MVGFYQGEIPGWCQETLISRGFEADHDSAGTAYSLHKKNGIADQLGNPAWYGQEDKNYSVKEISTEGRMVAQVARAAWILWDFKASIRAWSASLPSS